MFTGIIFYFGQIMSVYEIILVSNWLIKCQKGYLIRFSVALSSDVSTIIMWQWNEIDRMLEYFKTNQFELAAFTALATLDNPAPINASGCKDDSEFWVEVGNDDIDAVYMLLLLMSPEWQLGNPRGGDAHAGFIRFSFWRLKYSRVISIHITKI